MKARNNLFIRRALGIAVLICSCNVHAANYWFDNNGTTAGFGVLNGASYDWNTASTWNTDGTGGAGTMTTWPGGSNQAFFAGAGASTTYTIRLGATGSSNVTLQNFGLNMNSALSGASGNGNVTIGNSGDSGNLVLNAANSIGAYNGTLTINNGINLNAKQLNYRGGTIVINGVISGTGASHISSGNFFGLTSGTLTLAGNNTFAGNVTAASGYVFSLQHANALGATGGTNTVNSGGTMEVAGGASIVSGESISINGDGVSSFGALRAGSGGGTWNGGVTLASASRLGATAGNTLTVTGTISGGAGIGFNVSGQSGTGVVLLNPTTSNTYTGSTGIIRGILRLGKDDALPTGTTLDVDSVNSVSDAATFDMAGFNQTVAVLQDSATSNINGKITNSLASSTSTLTLNQASNTTFDGIIENGSGTLVLTKSGTGNLTLNGANTHTGGTNIENGKIVIGSGNDRLATGGSVTLGAVSSTGVLVLGDGTNARNQTLAGLTATGLGGAVVGNAAANSILTLAIASGTNTFGGTLGGAGTNENNLALNKTGAGELNLANANTFTGTTSINGGTIAVSHVSALGSSSSVSISTASGSGTLRLATDTSVDAYAIGASSGNQGTIISDRATAGAGITHALGAAALGNNTYHFQAGANVTSGTAGVSFASLNVAGGSSGTVVLNPTTANLTIVGSVSIASSNFAKTLNLDGTSSGNAISGIISNGINTLSLTKSNSGTWELSNANTFTGNTKVTGGSLILKNNLALQSSAFDTSGAGTLDLTDAAINTLTLGGLIGDAGTGQNLVLPSNVTSLALNPSAGTPTYVKNLSGGAAGLTLTKTGAGTQILGGTNTYTGLTTVNGGELRITSATAIGGSNVTVNSGQVALDGGITVSGKSLTTSGSGSNFLGGLQSVSGTNEWAGSVALGANLSRIGARKNATLIVSGAIDDGVDTFGLVVRNENSGSGNNGAGNANTVVVLSGANTYGGNTQLVNGLTKLDGGNNRLPVGTILQFGLGATNAKFDMNGRNQEVAGLAVTSASTDANRDWNANELTNSSGILSTLTVNTSTDQSFGGTLTNNVGTITGNIALVKDGSAKLTLSATNTYTGTTTVNAGTLVINGNISTSTTTVNNGGTLAGAGTTGPVSVANGGTLAPGNSPGTLNIAGDLGLNDSSLLAFEFDPLDMTVGGGVNDLVSVTGNLTLDGLLNVTATGGSFAGVTSGSWRLFNYSGALTNNLLALNTMPTLDPGYSWSLDLATGGQVNLTVIPEPRTALLGGLAGFILLRRRR
jgi:fibronectin-binding autotransporter adhesin